MGTDERMFFITQEIKRQPDNAALYLRRALVASDQGLPEQAFADVNKAIALGKPVDAALTRGILYYRAKQFAKADRDISRYMAVHPDDTWALEYRSRVRHDAGRRVDALSDYQRLIAIRPDIDVGFYYTTVELMRALSKRGATDALALLDARIAQVGNFPQLEQLAVDIERDRCAFDDAIGRLDRMAAASKSSPEWSLERAKLLILAGRETEATAYLDAAAAQLLARSLTRANLELRAQLSQLREPGIAQHLAVHCRKASRKASRESRQARAE